MSGDPRASAFVVILFAACLLFALFDEKQKPAPHPMMLLAAALAPFVGAILRGATQ